MSLTRHATSTVDAGGVSNYGIGLTLVNGSGTNRGVFIFVFMEDNPSDANGFVSDVTIGGGSVGHLVVHDWETVSPTFNRNYASIWFIPDADLPAGAGAVTITTVFAKNVDDVRIHMEEWTDVAQAGEEATNSQNGTGTSANVSLSGLTAPRLVWGCHEKGDTGGYNAADLANEVFDANLGIHRGMLEYSVSTSGTSNTITPGWTGSQPFASVSASFPEDIIAAAVVDNAIFFGAGL